MLFWCCFQENLRNETLLEQYEIVKKDITVSHVKEYGEMVFMTNGDSNPNNSLGKHDIRS